MKDDEVGCIVHNNLVTNMMYGLPQKWSQIMFITGKELKLFKRIATTKNASRWFGFEMINEIISQGGEFSAFYPRRAKIMDIDTSKDIARAEELLCVKS